MGLSEQRKYRTFTAQQKLEIVLAGLRGDVTVKELCRSHEIAETLYYSWREKLQVNRTGLYRTPKRRPGWHAERSTDPVDRLIVDVARATRPTAPAWSRRLRASSSDGR
jgi:transposase-like protein